MEKTYDELVELARAADNDGRPATVIEALTAAAQRGVALPSWYQFVLADNLRSIGRIGDARKILREINEVPEDKAWLVNLHRAKIEQDAGNIQQAAYSLETAVEQNPKSTIPYVYLACAYSTMQQYEKAIQVLTDALSVEGDLDEVYLNLGYHYRTLGRYREARDAFEHALRISPNYAQASKALRDVNSVLELLKGHSEETP